jgi:hypothetical protein
MNLYNYNYINTKSITLNLTYTHFKIIYDNLAIKLENEKKYTPNIDYTKYEISNIDEYIQKNDKFKILVCNGKPLSKQSNNVSLTCIVDKLSDKYSLIDFILTDKVSLIKDNILFTEDLIQAKMSDLNEISYLSLFCDVIIGKSSGPYSFSFVEKNINNIDKMYINISDSYHNGFWVDYNMCDKVWLTEYNENFIYDSINNSLKSKYNSYCTKKFINNIEILRENNRFNYKTSEDLLNIKIQIYINDGLGYEVFFDKIPKDIWFWSETYRKIETDDILKIQFYYFNQLILEKII